MQSPTLSPAAVVCALTKEWFNADLPRPVVEIPRIQDVRTWEVFPIQGFNHLLLWIYLCFLSCLLSLLPFFSPAFIVYLPFMLLCACGCLHGWSVTISSRLKKESAKQKEMLLLVTLFPWIRLTQESTRACECLQPGTSSPLATNQPPSQAASAVVMVTVLSWSSRAERSSKIYFILWNTVWKNM